MKTFFILWFLNNGGYPAALGTYETVASCEVAAHAQKKVFKGLRLYCVESTQYIFRMRGAK